MEQNNSTRGAQIQVRPVERTIPVIDIANKIFGNNTNALRTIEDIKRTASVLATIKPEEKEAKIKAERSKIDTCLKEAKTCDADIDRATRLLKAQQDELPSLGSALDQFKKAHKTLVERTEHLFRKACFANVHIDMYTDGWTISPGKNKPNFRAGLYLRSLNYNKIKNNYATALPQEIIDDLTRLCDELMPLWDAVFVASKDFWDKARNCTLMPMPSDVGAEDMYEQIIKLNKSEQEKCAELKRKKDAILKKKADSEAEIKAIEARYAKLQSEKESMTERLHKALQNLADLDPVLAGFSRCSDNRYDAKWIEMVKKAAEKRVSMPFLPFNDWDGRSLVNEGLVPMVYTWAPTNGSNASGCNLIIDSPIFESEDTRKAMLDTFVATILLAFPIKKVHVTVIERHQVNPFIANLPEKVCSVYDLHDNSEEIRELTRKLKEMNRVGKTQNIPPFAPREVVVLAGYDHNDREFAQLMDNLVDVVKDGAKSGIYFVLQLTDDYTRYTSQDGFVRGEYFCRYSTICTCNRAEGEWQPTNLLECKAYLTDENGKEQECTLADLITAYINKESTSTPNKVYDGIADGSMYINAPIKDLGTQPKSDVDNIVVPIAQTDDEQELDLRLNAVDYISYFILGRSGMGKSFTLHTILTNLMLKYDPSVVDIILMDFKPGGVEMNYYKDVPHVSKLLVNGADKQVAQEILQSIMREMDRRGQLFQQYDVASINNYNAYARRNGLEQMKHIVMLVDECQDLFKVQNPNSDVNIVTDIARKGRSYGIHMILATQTLQGADIPGDALAQFSDFLFMGCKEDDVVKCEINDRDVQRSVNTLTKGEVIYCHRSAAPVHGYIYNFAGKDGVYRNKTHDSLLSSRFTPAKEKQFYFNASQNYGLDQSELATLAERALSGTRPVPMAILGKKLSVTADTMYTRLRRGEGSNLLILGANDMLQGERVLWNAAMSLYHCNNAISQQSRYFILPNFPEEVGPEAKEVTDSRNRALRQFAQQPGVELVDEYDRSDIIERIAATVRQRTALADQDRRAVDSLDSIYLIIPNQQLYYTRMAKAPRGLASLDGGSAAPQAAAPQAEPSAPATTDSLGFEALADFGTAQQPEPAATAGPGFMSIDMNFGGGATPSFQAASAGRPGRDLSEELKQILANGPMVKVHVLLQSTTPEKIFADDMLRQAEMQLYFNDIVFLKMLQADRMSLPVDSRVIEKLSAQPNSLRALVYNGERGAQTIVPFDIPSTNDVH